MAADVEVAKNQVVFDFSDEKNIVVRVGDDVDRQMFVALMAYILDGQPGAIQEKEV